MSWLTFATALDSLPETFDAASFIDFPGKASCFVDSLANNCAQLLASSAITSEEFDSREPDLSGGYQVSPGQKAGATRRPGKQVNDKGNGNSGKLEEP